MSQNGNKIKLNFTKTQQAIMDVLRDGQDHEPEDLIACMDQGGTTKDNLSPHLTAMRKQLRLYGRDIICRSLGKRVTYVYVQLLRDPDGTDQ